MSVRQFVLGDGLRFCGCADGQCLDDPLSEAYFGAVGSNLDPHWTVVPPCSLNSKAHG
jgi:hypothetical protein